MTVNKGLLSLVENEPNFSNQALENAVDDIKAVDKDDGYQFIKSQFDVDEAIHNNTVLSQTQKNDALEIENVIYFRNIEMGSNIILNKNFIGIR